MEICLLKKYIFHGFFKSMHFFNRKMFFWRITISEAEFHCCYCQTSYLLMKRCSEQQLGSRIVQNQPFWFVSFQLKKCIFEFFLKFLVFRGKFNVLRCRNVFKVLFRYKSSVKTFQNFENSKKSRFWLKKCIDLKNPWNMYFALGLRQVLSWFWKF